LLEDALAALKSFGSGIQIIEEIEAAMFGTDLKFVALHFIYYDNITYELIFNEC